MEFLQNSVPFNNHSDTGALGALDVSRHVLWDILLAKSKFPVVDPYNNITTFQPTLRRGTFRSKILNINAARWRRGLMQGEVDTHTGCGTLRSSRRAKTLDVLTPRGQFTRNHRGQVFCLCWIAVPVSRRRGPFPSTGRLENVLRRQLNYWGKCRRASGSCPACHSLALPHGTRLFFLSSDPRAGRPWLANLS